MTEVRIRSIQPRHEVGQLVGELRQIGLIGGELRLMAGNLRLEAYGLRLCAGFSLSGIASRVRLVPLDRLRERCDLLLGRLSSAIDIPLLLLPLMDAIKNSHLIIEVYGQQCLGLLRQIAESPLLRGLPCLCFTFGSCDRLQLISSPQHARSRRAPAAPPASAKSP